MGLLVVVLGVALIFDAVAWFARIETSPDPGRPTTKIVDEGPYQFTRNPMYLGMALIMGGLALLGDALWPLLALIPVLYVIRTAVIDKEERYLEAKFGDGYRGFKARVRRWL